MVFSKVLIAQILLLAVFCEIQEETEIMNERLTYYDRRFRPMPREEPLVVSATFSVAEFGPFDYSKQSLRVLADVTQEWLDPRLAFSSESVNELILPFYYRDNLWLPDIFFPETKSVKIVSSLREAGDIRISKNGTVTLSWLADIEASCPMMYVYFPFDVQTCRISISSYGYTKNDVILKWQSKDALDVFPWITVHNFILVGQQAHEYSLVYNSGDEYSNLDATFYFRRFSFYYVMQLFFPAVVIVLISFASLWVPKDYVTLRMGLGLATIFSSLFLCYLGNLAKNEASTMSICDVYLLVSFFYVFGIATRNFCQNFCCGCCNGSSKVTEMDDEASSINFTGNYSSTSICDKVCGILVPLSYIGFNLLICYCIQKISN